MAMLDFIKDTFTLAANIADESATPVGADVFRFSWNVLFAGLS